MAAQSLPPLDWGRGVWQQTALLQEIRKNFVHRILAETDLFPEVEAAEKAIEVVRGAVKDIYRHVGKPEPPWLKDDYDDGWAVRSGMTVEAYAHTATCDNVAGAVKLTFVYKDREIISDFLAPGSDPDFAMQALAEKLNRPISAIRAYVDNVLVREELFDVSKMRGGPHT